MAASLGICVHRREYRDAVSTGALRDELAARISHSSHPPGILAGLVVVALTVVDGAAFLGSKTRGSLRDDASTYGAWAVVSYLVLTALTLGVTYATAPSLRSSFRSPAVFALVLVTGLLTAGYVAATRRHRYYLVFATAASLVFTLIALLAVLMFPFIDRATGLVVRDTIVSTLPLNLMTIMASVLLPLVLGYFAALYFAFRGPVERVGIDR